MLKNTAVIIPVYNEAEVLAEVIKAIEQAACIVICVDDGSKDNSAEIIKNSSAILVRQPINMGQGAALQTGIEFALQLPEIKYFVTFDADGQHNVNDVIFMQNLLEKENLDIVLGSRFLGSAINMPTTKKALLKLALIFTNTISKVNLTDTHNGLRVFNRSFAEAMDIKMHGMAHASEIIDMLRPGKWKYKEAPVTITYSDYSRAKGQSVLNLFSIMLDLLIYRSKQ